MTIKLKTIIAVILCFAIFSVSVIFMSNKVYYKNIESLSQQAVDRARASFTNLETNDTRMLSSTLEGLLINDTFKNAFIKHDRQKLFDLTKPLFDKLHKNYSITHFYFIDPPPSNKCFLRVHNPKIFDDEIKRITYVNSTITGSFGTGLELGKTAFALRAVHPVYQGKNLIGYLELGEEIDHFLSIMKSQTKDDYGLVVLKEKLDRDAYLEMRKNNNLPDEWEDIKDVVIIGRTMSNDSIIHQNINISEIPENGMVMEKLKHGKNVFVKGIFPILDANSNKVGAVFVLHDITASYKAMKTMQTGIVLFIIIICVFMSVFIIVLFDKLIFARLENINEIATRVVGGDYDCSVKVQNDDEIGNIESLFEQLRLVFIDTIKQLKDKK